MSDPLSTRCHLHGVTRATLLCVHLREGQRKGFHQSGAPEGDPWPDAWCDACQAALVQAGRWTEEITHFFLSCTGCYDVARLRHVVRTTPSQVERRARARSNRHSIQLSHWRR